MDLYIQLEVSYGHVVSAKTTPALRGAVLCFFEPQRFGVFEPRRVCGYLLKPC